jgi:prepilin signal peptidase PulO-like enzyme (type II secretory pathway)
MNLPPLLLALLFSLLVASSVAWVMPSIPDPRCRPSRARRGLLFLIVGVVAFLVLANAWSFESLQRQTSLPLLPMTMIPVAAWPLALLVVAISLGGLYATTGSDLFYDRIVSRDVVGYPTLIIFGLYALAVPFFGLPALLMSLAGAFLGWLLGKAMSLPARLLAKARQAPDDVLVEAPIGSRCLICGQAAHMANIVYDDGESAQAEDFGEGDVWVLRLIGALLGPVGVVLMLVPAILLNGLLAVPIIIRDRLQQREVGSSYLPYVPALCIATVYVLLTHTV